jgi:quercetin dioxygenase-like cupin family protein
LGRAAPWFILRRTAQVSCLRGPVNSNVRRREAHHRRILAVMALSHIAPGQIIDLAPLGPKLQVARTVALFKSENLEVIRLVLQAGKSLPPHKVAGEITIQCIEGAISVSAKGTQTSLRAGQLIYLAGDVLHGVLADEDSSALVTIALLK